MIGKILGMKHDFGWLLESSILTFHNPVLLWVIGEDNSCPMPSKEQKSTNLLFSNSFPWSLRILMISLSFSLWILWHRSLNTSKTSDFYLMKFTHMNIEKSSTTTYAYLFPQRLSTRIGPIRSIWRSSKTFEVVWCCNFGCDIFVCFPIWHSPCILPSSILSRGIL